VTANNLVVTLALTDKVHVAAQTTWSQALAVVGRVLVETACDAVQLVLQAEDTRRLTAGRLGLELGIAADAGKGDLVQNQKKQGDNDNLGWLHLLESQERKYRLR